jgi:hypothetical protein
MNKVANVSPGCRALFHLFLGQKPVVVCTLQQVASHKFRGLELLLNTGRTDRFSGEP